jgi:hypothetical protein
MPFKSLVTAACLFVVSASTTLAATYTVGGSNYDVTTFEGSFENNQTLLEGQVWFNNFGLANDFVDAIGDTLGLLNSRLGAGPVFAFSTYSFGGFDNVEGRAFSQNHPFQRRSVTGTIGSNFVFAVATLAPPSPVPSPAGGLLLLSGLAGVAGLKRRKKRAAKV